jgi:hypothetical protein
MISGHGKTDEKADGMVSLNKVLKNSASKNICFIFLIKINLFYSINKRRTPSPFS